MFQVNAGTGTATYNPELLNDNNVASLAQFHNVGEYVEVEFIQPFQVGQYRYYGEAGLNNDGSAKIQHWDEGWVDNTTGLSTRGESWTPWTPLTTPVLTTKIRMVATVIDTSGGKSRYGELEMKG